MENAPALELDKILYKDRAMLPHTRRERRIVWNLLQHLEHFGWNVAQVFDGDEDPKVNNVKDAMEIIFNLDDAVVSFVKAGGGKHGVRLVLGNDLDVISDWYYTDGDPDGFDAAMNAFNTEEYA